jgi:2-octaprenyl-6-methoxyphenol hydroxylase
MDNPAARPIVQRMRRDADVVIVGGGLNGPALALALAGAGVTPLVVDARPAPARATPGFDGRAYALALASQRLLAAVGVWPRVAAVAQPIRAVRAADGRAGEGASPFFLHVDGAEIDEGPMGAMVEDRFLYGAFRDALAAAGVPVLSGETVVAQEPGAVTLASGRRLAAALVVGADGRDSGTAQRAGIGRVGWDYGQTALVCAIAHERPHNGVAHQLFLPEGPLAILPLPGNRASIVWTETTANAAAIQALDDPGYLAALRPRVGDFLGGIGLVGTRFTYPLALRLAERFVAPRLALVGDAAHGVHPIAGQGLNLGLRDVGALAEVVVAAARRGEDIGSADVLARYERWRRFDTTLTALGMDAVNRLFSNDNPVLRGLRDLGLGAVSRMPGLRRALQRQAAGLAGDVPRLLAGRAL